VTIIYQQRVFSVLGQDATRATPLLVPQSQKTGKSESSNVSSKRIRAHWPVSGTMNETTQAETSQWLEW